MILPVKTELRAVFPCVRLHSNLPSPPHPTPEAALVLLTAPSFLDIAPLLHLPSLGHRSQMRHCVGAVCCSVSQEHAMTPCQFSGPRSVSPPGQCGKAAHSLCLCVGRIVRSIQRTHTLDHTHLLELLLLACPKCYGHSPCKSGRHSEVEHPLDFVHLL